MHCKGTLFPVNKRNPTWIRGLIIRSEQWRHTHSHTYTCTHSFRLQRGELSLKHLEYCFDNWLCIWAVQFSKNGKLVHRFAPDWKISITIQWTSMIFCSDIHGYQRMNLSYFGDSLAFHLAPPWDWRFCILWNIYNWIYYWKDWHKILLTLVILWIFLECHQQIHNFIYPAKYLNIHLIDWRKMFGPDIHGMVSLLWFFDFEPHHQVNILCPVRWFMTNRPINLSCTLCTRLIKVKLRWCTL